MADVSPLQQILDVVIVHQDIALVVLAVFSAPFAYQYRQSLGALLAKLPAIPDAVNVPFHTLSKNWYRRVGTSLWLIIPLVLALFAARRPVPQTFWLTAFETVCARPGDDSAILFIHGWNGDAQRTWRQFPALACADRRLNSTAIIVADYPTYMLRRNLRIVQVADWLRRSIDVDNDWSKYRRVGVVAHSMGGLVARELRLLETVSGRPSRSVILVEIATPHEGANLARMAAALGIAREQTEELSSGSSFLTTLRTQWTQLADRPRTSCFVGVHDEVVSETSALADCDQKLLFPDWGHIEVVKPVTLGDTRYALPIGELINSLTLPR